MRRGWHVLEPNRNECTGGFRLVSELWGHWKQRESKSGAGDRLWGLLHPVLGLKIELREHYASGRVKYLLLLLFIMVCAGEVRNHAPSWVTGPFPNKAEGREAAHSRGHN